MMKRYLPFASALLFTLSAQSQYCEPTFLFGCTSWQNQAVVINGIDWATDFNCFTSDHTELTATVQAGVPTSMSVTSGVWTGCAVWVDLNNDQEFTDDENLYYQYVGGDPYYVYDFSITVPANTLAGTYRMRVVAPWGSDGFLDSNTNGYGPCGAYQYGNFNDFLLSVESTSSVAERTAPTALELAPNPVADVLTITAASAIQQLTVFGADGRMVIDQVDGAAGLVRTLDLGALPAGIYQLWCLTADGVQKATVVRQ
jgi:hypothetical protein